MSVAEEMAMAERAAVFGGRPFFRPRGVSELGTLDIPATTTVISTTASFTLLNPVQQGTAFYQRDKMNILMKSIHLRGQIDATANGTGVPEYLRIMIVYDRQVSAAAAVPNVADVLSDVDQAGAITSTSRAGKNMTNADRFLILKDHKMAIPTNNTGAAANTADNCIIDPRGEKYNIDCYLSLGLETKYASTANPLTQANIATGALYLLCYGNVAAATAGYQFIWNSRLRYSDF